MKSWLWDKIDLKYLLQVILKRNIFPCLEFKHTFQVSPPKIKKKKKKTERENIWEQQHRMDCFISVQLFLIKMETWSPRSETSYTAVKTLHSNNVHEHSHLLYPMIKFQATVILCIWLHKKRIPEFGPATLAGSYPKPFPQQLGKALG